MDPSAGTDAGISVGTVVASTAGAGNTSVGVFFTITGVAVAAPGPQALNNKRTSCPIVLKILRLLFKIREFMDFMKRLLFEG